MTLEQLRKMMPEGMSDDDLKAKLVVINDDAKAMAEAETKGLKENKDKLLSQLTKLKENQIPDGFDPEGYKKYLEDKDAIEAKKKELEDAELEGKGQWEALKLKLVEKHNKEFETLKGETGTEIGSLKKALDSELIENHLVKEIIAEGGNPLFLLPHMKPMVETVKGEDGKFSLQIVGEDGKPLMSEDQTKPFSTKDLVAKFKSDELYSPAFPGMNNGGGGNPNAGGNGGGATNPWKADTKNITEQARINKENPALAAQMKKSAGIKTA